LYIAVVDRRWFQKKSMRTSDSKKNFSLQICTLQRRLANCGQVLKFSNSLFHLYVNLVCK
jgi:hypothetical protein